MNPPDFVHELGHRLNLTGLKLTNGICRLMFDHSIPIDIEDDGIGNLYFHCKIATLPHQGREAFMAHLLSAHLFGLETDGAVFGVHPKTQDIYLFRCIPVEALEAEGALKVLERFTQQAENWRKRVQDLANEAAAKPPGQDNGPSLSGDALRA